MNTKISTFDEYVSQFDEQKQIILYKMRDLFRANAPDAVESISYGMPAYKLNGPLVYFGMMKNHLGLYPTGSSLSKFEKELEPYHRSKGAIQFQLKEEIPYDLIAKILRFRVQENLEKK